jgi:hypothetical protein
MIKNKGGDECDGTRDGLLFDNGKESDIKKNKENIYDDDNVLNNDDGNEIKVKKKLILIKEEDTNKEIPLSPKRKIDDKEKDQIMYPNIKNNKKKILIKKDGSKEPVNPVIIISDEKNETKQKTVTGSGEEKAEKSKEDKIGKNSPIKKKLKTLTAKEEEDKETMFSNITEMKREARQGLPEDRESLLSSLKVEKTIKKNNMPEDVDYINPPVKEPKKGNMLYRNELENRRERFEMVDVTDSGERVVVMEYSSVWDGDTVVINGRKKKKKMRVVKAVGGGRYGKFNILLYTFTCINYMCK